VFVVNQRASTPGGCSHHRPLRRHHAVRAADGVAAVHQEKLSTFKVSLREVCGPASRSIPK